MKLIIFGASGLTGRELVRQALEKGHEVTAFLRLTSVLPVSHRHLRMRIGERNEPAHVQDVVKGQDSVFSALRTSRFLSENFGLTQRFKNVVGSMARSGVRRLLYLSALIAGDRRDAVSLAARALVVSFILKHTYANREQNERTLQTSSLEWVVVRPSVLTNGLQTGRYLAARHLRDRFPFGLVSQADVAHFMLRQLTSGQHVRQAVTLQS